MQPTPYLLITETDHIYYNANHAIQQKSYGLKLLCCTCVRGDTIYCRADTDVVMHLKTLNPNSCYKLF